MSSNAMAVATTVEEVVEPFTLSFEVVHEFDPTTQAPEAWQTNSGACGPPYVNCTNNVSCQLGSCTADE